MRTLSSAQGRSKRFHYVPDGQFVALCGFLPGLGSTWWAPRKPARVCVDCHRLHHTKKGICYSQERL